jgi:hypothetical protein
MRVRGHVMVAAARPQNCEFFDSAGGLVYRAMRIVRFSVDVSGVRQLRQRHPIQPPSLHEVTTPPQAPAVDPGAAGNEPAMRTTPFPGGESQP